MTDHPDQDGTRALAEHLRIAAKQLRWAADNLAAAHSSTHAAVYDVNSALEVSPGVKSSDLLPPLFRVWNKIKRK